MDVNGIIKLVEAGFTKEDIFKLAGASNPEPAKAEPAPEPAKAEPAPEPEKAEPEDVESKINEAIENAIKPFETLYNNFSKLAGMPSIDKVEPKSIDDIIDSFFKGD